MVTPVLWRQWLGVNESKCTELPVVRMADAFEANGAAVLCTAILATTQFEEDEDYDMAPLVVLTEKPCRMSCALR